MAEKIKSEKEKLPEEEVEYDYKKGQKKSATWSGSDERSFEAEAERLSEQREKRAEQMVNIMLSKEKPKTRRRKKQAEKITENEKDSEQISGAPAPPEDLPIESKKTRLETEPFGKEQEVKIEKVKGETDGQLTKEKYLKILQIKPGEEIPSEVKTEWENILKERAEKAKSKFEQYKADLEILYLNLLIAEEKEEKNAAGEIEKAINIMKQRMIDLQRKRGNPEFTNDEIDELIAQDMEAFRAKAAQQFEAKKKQAPEGLEEEQREQKAVKTKKAPEPAEGIKSGKEYTRIYTKEEVKEGRAPKAIRFEKSAEEIEEAKVAKIKLENLISQFELSLENLKNPFVVGRNDKIRKSEKEEIKEAIRDLKKDLMESKASYRNLKKQHPELFSEEVASRAKREFHKAEETREKGEQEIKDKKEKEKGGVEELMSAEQMRRLEFIGRTFYGKLKEGGDWTGYNEDQVGQTLEIQTLIYMTNQLDKIIKNREKAEVIAKSVFKKIKPQLKII